MEAIIPISLGNKLIDMREVDTLISLPVLPSSSNKLDKWYNRFIKRAMDLLISTGLILSIFPWLLPIIAILIKLDSKGPVFFVQKRTGLNMKSFYCIKFRSMVVNDDADRLEVQPNDTRITRVGSVLRKFHLDEMPQLINVFIGNMSLVGPRPLMLRHTVLYSRIIKDYHNRHLVKPGLTGLAQMRGYYGSINNTSDLFQRCASDVEYIAKWSLFSDLWIFFGTVFQQLGKL